MQLSEADRLSFALKNAILQLDKNLMPYISIKNA